MKCANCDHWLSKVPKSVSRRDGRKVVHSFGGVCCGYSGCHCHAPVEKLVEGDVCSRCNEKKVTVEYVEYAEFLALLKRRE